MTSAQAERIDASIAGSTLPPDRIITVGPGGVCGQSVAGQRHRAARLADQVGPQRDLAHRGANVVLRHGDHARRAPAADVRRSARTAASAGRRRWCGCGPRSTSRPGARRPGPAAVSAASSGSTPITRACGHSALIAVPMPDARPPPLTGISTVATSGRSSAISSPMVPCPAMTSGWSNGGTSTPPVRATTSSATFSRCPAAHSTTSAPWLRVAADLDVGRLLRHDDVRGNAERGGRVGDGLGVVAARVGDHSPRPGGRIEVTDRVERTTDLERADRLQVLRLDPQRALGVPPRGGQQRRAHHRPADAVCGRPDVIDRDQLHDSSLSAPAHRRYAAVGRCRGRRDVARCAM